MGGVTTSILFFFCHGKFVPPVFEGPAGKRDFFFFFPDDYTLMLDLRTLAGFF